jgi:hypothetical protein
MTAPEPETPTGSDETIERGELVETSPGGADEDSTTESVEEPGRVMRIGAMIKQLLEEVRAADLDEAGRDRLREIYDQSVTELSGALSDDLADELGRLASPFGDQPASAGELRVAQAQLVGWLEGLFHGIQATLFAQQAAARQQLEQMRHQLVAGQQPGGPDQQDPGPGTGTYL